MGAAAVGSNLLLFALVFGMSATVDIKDLKKQIGNKNALLTGVFLQFVVLPFLGFAVVKALNLSAAMGVTLLVVTSSPGGSYSNWWCSMFNADLPLSVTMTAVSTILSTVMLPLNLWLYASASYDDDVIKSLDWASLFTSLAVVISAIGLGLLSSAKHTQWFPRMNSEKFHLYSNRVGSLVGILLMVFSALVSNSDEDNQIWERNWRFYVATALPCVLGLAIANVVTTYIRLRHPERVTASIECCYQNVGIATSVAMTMFEGDELAVAMGVPFFYGIVEMVVLSIYCLGAWKAGWTKAPKDEKIWVIIGTSYEVVHDPGKDKIIPEGTMVRDMDTGEPTKDPADVEKPKEKEVCQDPPQASQKDTATETV